MAEMSKMPLDHKAEVAKGSRLKHYLPILSWLPEYPKGQARSDIIAGATSWVELVPEAIAYAQLAGVQPQAGLFAAPFLLLGYALCGSSRQIIVGSTSASAIMLAATVGSLAGSDSGRYATILAGMTLLIGLIFLVLGIARLGFVKNFLAESVLTGFVFGLALVIAIGQVPKLFGLPRVSGSFFEKLWQVISHLSGTNLWTLLVGVLSLALLFALERFLHRVPASLVAVLFGILLVTVFHLDRHGVAIVGVIPGGFPLPVFPRLSFSDVTALLPGAFGVVLVLYAEHISAAQKFASQYHYDIDADQELIALGVANLGAGFFQGFAGGGSLSKTTVNAMAGGRSQMVSLVGIVLLVLTLLVLTPIFHNLPEATLAAVIINAVWGLLDVKALRRYTRLRRTDLVLALTALLGVLVFDILPGLLLAVILSLVLLIYRASRPQSSLLGKMPDKQTYGDIDRHPENKTIPGLLIYRLDAPLFFANAALVRDQVKALVHTTIPAPRVVLLDMEASNHLDVPSLDTLVELASEIQAEGTTLKLVNVHGGVRDLLRRSRRGRILGGEPDYPSLEEGVQLFLKTQP